MNRLLLAMALLSAPAFAQPASEEEKLSFCVTVSNFSETVMNNRQKGVELPEQLNLVGAADEQVQSILKPIIMTAYDSPRYRAESNRADEVKRYKERTLLECLRNI